MKEEEVNVIHITILPNFKTGIVRFMCMYLFVKCFISASIVSVR